MPSLRGDGIFLWGRMVGSGEARKHADSDNGIAKIKKLSEEDDEIVD